MLKKIVAGAAGVVAVSILSYLSYKMVKEINSVDLDDGIWENMDDVFSYRTAQNHQSS
jgi:hypothetical protein